MQDSKELTPLEILKKKQAKEMLVFEMEQEIQSSISYNLKMFVNINNIDTTVFIDLEKVKISEISSILKEITNKYPATRLTKDIDYKGKKKHFSPYLLLTESNINTGGRVILEYTAKDFNIRITMPIKFYSDDIVGYSMRGVTSSEHHYFGGVSMKEISRRRVEKRSFDLFTSLDYYGGSTKCIIEDIEDLEQYNCVALNGHTPEFLEFWETQKENL